MTFSEALAKIKPDTVSSVVGVFRGMVGNLAEVNIGESTVQIPCDGFSPPIPGMSVRVMWVNGSPVVQGPVKTLNPRGVIKAGGSPKATVTVDGVDYLLYVQSGYTASVNDIVAIRWDYEGGLITGKVQGYETPKPPPPVTPPSKQPFSGLVVRAEASGRYQSGAGWGGNDPWASASNVGIWTYGDSVRAALAGASNLKADIYLPLVQELSGAKLAAHDHPSIPGGAPTLHSAVPSVLNGWIPLPDNFASYLAVGGRGIGVVEGGYTIWRGVAGDSMSGALRFSGVR